MVLIGMMRTDQFEVGGFRLATDSSAVLTWFDSKVRKSAAIVFVCLLTQSHSVN